jgi:CRISPR/Cas system-associated protein endoribonuclease Cas2
MQYIFLILAMVLFGYADEQPNCIIGGFLCLAFSVWMVTIPHEETNKRKRKRRVASNLPKASSLKHCSKD